MFSIVEGGTVVLLLTSAAFAPWHPSQVGAGMLHILGVGWGGCFVSYLCALATLLQNRSDRLDDGELRHAATMPYGQSYTSRSHLNHAHSSTARASKSATHPSVATDPGLVKFPIKRQVVFALCCVWDVVWNGM